jgi:hypothetical protein
VAAISTIVAAVGVGIAAAGTGAQMYASAQQAKAQKKSIAIQQKAEELREKQMNLDSMRKKREQIRQAQVAQAQALSTATNQGAQASSGLEGAMGQISGQSGVNVLGINQNQELGAAMFQNNRDLLASRGREADAGTLGIAAQGLSSLGGAMVKNSGTIGKIGEYYGWGKA